KRIRRPVRLRRARRRIRDWRTKRANARRGEDRSRVQFVRGAMDCTAELDGLSEMWSVLVRIAPPPAGDSFVLEWERYGGDRRIHPQRTGAPRVPAGDVLHDAGNGQRESHRTVPRQGRYSETRCAWALTSEGARR